MGRDATGSHPARPTTPHPDLELRSYTSLRPCSVSHGSWCSMLCDNGAMISRQPAGGDDRGVAELADDAPAHAVYLRGEPVERSRLDRLDGRLADDAARLDQLDTPERSGVVEQRVERYRDAGGDGAPQVLAVDRDGVEGRRGPQVHDDAGASVEVVGADGVGDPVGTDLLRVVVEDGHPRAQPGLEHHARHVEPPRRHLAQRRR